MKGSERADLRSEAHHLDASVHLGQHGMTPAFLTSLDDALRTRELVKVKLAKGSDAKPKDTAGELAAATGSEVIQVIGRTATLYRHNPDSKRKKGDVPLWRR